MPIRVPQVQGQRVQQRGLGLQQTNVQVTRAALGGGQGAAAVRNAVGRLGNTLQNLAVQQKQKADRSAVKEAARGLTDKFIDLNRRLDESQGKAAIDFENVGLEEFDKFVEDSKKGMANDTQRSLFDNAVNSRRQSFRMAAARKAVREADRLDEINTKTLGS